MTIKAEIVTITPEMAAELLKQNKVNRPPKGAAIKRYAEDMRAGRWAMTGQAIIVREDGILLDGQNRLMAAIESEASFDTLMVTNVNGAALDAIDIGQARSLGDQLHWRGVSNANTVAAALRWAWRYDKMVEMNWKQPGPYLAPRDEELDYFDRNRMLFDAAATEILPLRRRIPGPQSVPIFVHLLIHRFANLDTANTFYQQVAYDFEEENAAAMLKDWLLQHNARHARPGPTVTAAIHIKAARFWLNNITPQKILWKHRGASTQKHIEPFPRIDAEPYAKSTRYAKGLGEFADFDEDSE